MSTIYVCVQRSAHFELTKGFKRVNYENCMAKTAYSYRIGVSFSALCCHVWAKDISFRTLIGVHYYGQAELKLNRPKIVF